jgi:hypothetical protein
MSTQWLKHEGLFVKLRLLMVIYYRVVTARFWKELMTQIILQMFQFVC